MKLHEAFAKKTYPAKKAAPGIELLADEVMGVIDMEAETHGMTYAEYLRMFQAEPAQFERLYDNVIEMISDMYYQDVHERVIEKLKEVIRR